MAVSCLYTIVENASGKERFFSFLGPHGARLADGEQLAVRGNILSTLAGRKKKFAALERALDGGVLKIVSTPGVHLYDATNGVTKTLSLDAATLGTVDPCWTAS